jgi:hypothetical protein
VRSGAAGSEAALRSGPEVVTRATQTGSSLRRSSSTPLNLFEMIRAPRRKGAVRWPKCGLQFNLENFDETAVGEWPSLAERIQLMRPQILRLRADIVCFQEVNGQERPNQPRSLLALTQLLTSTNLAGAQLASTRTANNEVYDKRTW